MGFLSVQPERDVHLRGLVWRLGTELPEGSGWTLGWWVGGQLRGVFLHGPVVLIACEDLAGLRAFAERVGTYWYEVPVAQLMSPRSMAEPFLATLADYFGGLPTLQHLRHRMPAMRLRRPDLINLRAQSTRGTFEVPSIRPAVLAEEQKLLEIAREVTIEDLKLDPLDFEPEHFLLALQHRIRLGQELVCTEGDMIVFRTALSAATPEVVLLEGVYVPPEKRGKGYGKRGMYALCERLLQHHDSVVLLVGEDNDRARMLYEGLGFQTFDEYQVAFFNLEARRQG